MGVLIHFGGYAGEISGYELPSGGMWTTALVDGLDPSATFEEWFRAAALKMPERQVPVHAEWGAGWMCFGRGGGRQR